MSGPGSVQSLQPFNISVTDWQSVNQLVDTFQVWRQTAQLQQVNLVTHFQWEEFMQMTSLFCEEAPDAEHR